MSANIVYAILVTSLATFLSRFLGAVTSEGIKETSKLLNCRTTYTMKIDVLLQLVNDTHARR